MLNHSPRSHTRIASIIVAGFFALVSLTNLNNGFHASPRTSFVEDVLEQSRAKYAALKTYSDAGTVTTEYAFASSDPVAVEKHTFTTFYRAPRQYFFEFKKDPNVSDERFVIWADRTDFNTWWSSTHVHDTYPKGHGAEAFALASFPTRNSSMQLSPLLFAQAGLHGPIVDLKVLTSDQIEQVNGHRCHKLVGEVGLAYGTGTVTNIRPTTIWIDAESLLIRKVLEDTPKGTGGIDRSTTTFEPQADVQIDDAHFKFTPPQ
jgi:outer membrane lipoprotein-sorting protein